MLPLSLIRCFPLKHRSHKSTIHNIIKSSLKKRVELEDCVRYAKTCIKSLEGYGEDVGKSMGLDVVSSGGRQ